MLEKKVQIPAGKLSKFLLVTPVWNDSERLEGFGTALAQTLATCRHDVHWVIADDGSGEAEHQALTALQARLAKIYPKMSLHFAAAHWGKGSVVREAWALESSADADWLAFVDADGSLSPTELLRMFDTAEKCGKTVLGIRKNTATTKVNLTPLRFIAHRLFILSVRLLVGVHCTDPQCGAKVLLATDYRPVAETLKENGLAFDAEMLTALSERGAQWQELPVTWIEKEGGKVNPLRDAWGMLAALWKIRVRLKKGEFKASQ